MPILVVLCALLGAGVAVGIGMFFTKGASRGSTGINTAAGTAPLATPETGPTNEPLMQAEVGVSQQGYVENI